MKALKILICLALLFAFGMGAVEARKPRVAERPLYMIGVALSHVDSTVFITDMHLVNGLTVERKTRFLMDRQLYSLQLKRYLDETYKGGPYLVAVYFHPKMKKMERRYLSLHKRYVQSKELNMVLIDQSQFRFKPEEYIEDTIFEGQGPDGKKGGKLKKPEKPQRPQRPQRPERQQR